MTTPRAKIFDAVLNSEEQELSDAIDNAIDKGKLKSVSNLKEEMAIAKQAAHNYFRKDARITVRLSGADLVNLKQKAAYKGLPYQTFVSSILHEYLSGHFIEVG